MPARKTAPKKAAPAQPGTYGSRPSLAERLRPKTERAGVDTAPHLIVEALAGTGKTTTLVGGVTILRGGSVSLTPSPQQKAVWDAINLSRGKAESVCFVAFNKSIATELQSRLPAGCEAMTLHSLGNKAVCRAFGRLRLNEYRVEDIISEILEKDIRELRRENITLVQATKQLVALCKQNLVGTDTNDHAGDWVDGGWEVALDQLAAHYDVEMNGSREKVFDLVPKVLERCKNVEADRAMDFNDMIWLPVALNLPVTKYDLLLVDEAQDLNRCQQQLALKSGRRLVLCGDVNQAIYGFAGADADSIPRMAQLLGATERGVERLPLTVTRRCGKAIVEEARKIVPAFEAHENNGEGKISNAPWIGTQAAAGSVEDADPSPSDLAKASACYRDRVLDGDFIICRVNAPLVSQCFRFLKEGRKAQIQGRDVGQGLINLVKKLCKLPGSGSGGAVEVSELMDRLEQWADGEVKKVNASKNPNEARLIAIEDKKECLLTFCEDASTVGEVVQRIERVFSDSSTSGIRLSSIHKAKGLEAKRVFFLQPPGASCPHPMAKSPWQKGQEMNLKYVGITRAIEELIWVS